jgi:PAS domain S-box-containing protein
MRESTRARLVAYGVAVLAPALTLFVRAASMPVLDDRARYIIFCPAVMIAAYLGGLRPGLLATLICAAAMDFFLIPPLYSFRIEDSYDALALSCFILVGVVSSGLCESLHRSRRRALANERRYAVTLASIGDAVLATDTQARVTFLNPAAEALTGWASADAVGRPLAEVFRIVNEETRQPLEDFAAKVLRLGTVVGLANHTALLTRDGRETPIDDCGAPILDERGAIAGVVLVFRDVSQRRQADEAAALRESEQRWRSLTEALPQLVWSATPDGACDYFSTQWTEYTGALEADLLGWRWLETLHPDDREPTRQFWLESVAGCHAYDVEYRVRRHDGEYRWFKTRGVPIRDGTGNVVKWFGTCTDITDLRQTEEALRVSEERFRTLAKATNDAVWDWDLGTNKVWWNEGVLTLFGYRLETNETAPDWWLERVHPDDHAAVEAFFFDVVRGTGLTWVDEYRFRCADGSYKDVYDRGYVLRNAEGRATRMIGAMLDITARKRAEEALRESEERFRGTFENAAVGIAHTHPTGRLLRVNEKFCAIVGHPREELLRKTFQDITHPDDLAASVGSLAALLQGEALTLAHEKRYLRKDGSTVWVELFTSLQRDGAGQPAYAIAVIQDISERKRLDAELRRAMEAAEAANRAKDEFLANVSHEIRTPMNAILGMTELTLDTPLTEDQRQCLRTVKSAANNLLGIINDLLDFAKIESGRMELDRADFSLRAAVGDTLRALAVRAHKQGLELIYQVRPDVPDALVGDAGRLRQVLLNLVGNAIKFTEDGEVVVGVEVDADPRPSPEAGDVALRFTVRDTGIGIPPEQQERIFRAFEQEDTSTTRKYGGTGLGLTIASRLVALMAGTITVDSAPGRGSTFTCTARFGLQPHPPEQLAARPPVLLHGLHVLIVDDNATNRQILEGWLRGWQMEPAAVGEGLAALDALWEAVSAGRPYALVLLDARLPDTDGLALAAKIRKRAELSATRIILLTSGDRPGDLARAREQRVDSHLLKPVQQDELLETIHRVMSRSNSDVPTAPGPSGAGERPRAPLHILVAEDNEFNAQLLEMLLGGRGHRVRLANNGREALSLTREGGFDLLLLDVHMPELDGFQVIQAVRERERTTGGHLPVIALTARSRKEDREQCLAAGMDDFLAKPVQTADLWAAIDRVAGARPPVDGAAPGLLAPRVLLAACGGDATILERIGQTFRACLPERLNAVRGALRDGDAPRLREAAHKLAGMVAAFSTVAGGVASELEDCAAQGRLEEAEPLVERLEAMAEQLTRLVAGLSLEDVRAHAGEAAEPGRITGP